MDSNTNSERPPIASRNAKERTGRDHRAGASGSRYPNADRSPGTLDYNPYFSTPPPRELSQAAVGSSCRPSNSTSPYSSLASLEQGPEPVHRPGSLDTPFLNSPSSRVFSEGSSAAAFSLSPYPFQSPKSHHVPGGGPVKKQKSRFFQKHSKRELQSKGSGFLDWLKRRKASKESSPFNSPEDKCEETETRFSRSPSERKERRGPISLPAFEARPTSKLDPNKKSGRVFTLAAKFEQRETLRFVQGQTRARGQSSGGFYEPDNSLTKGEYPAFDWGPPPPIPKKSPKRRAYSHELGSTDLRRRIPKAESDVQERQYSLTPTQKNNVVYSDSEYSEIEEDLLPNPLRIVKRSPAKDSIPTKSDSYPPNSQGTGHRDLDLPLANPSLILPNCTMSGFLQVSAVTPKKTKAEEDAALMQASVIEAANKAKTAPPPYVLLELIGKGSFGRVYKGRHVASLKIVAVKIIDLDESDTLNPRLANTYSEFMKEVNALKILSDSKARNINHVIEALPVGKAMWMITEYCGGGSIATLMKPTPSGLKERFTIPILREAAEAIKWVHQAGIIHRDLKCANVLITEQGGVQLCDFGVAGITDTPLDKRSTWIGTPNWMAPELLEGLQYGKEVDIWAFGSMAYEMATGLPPNAKSGVTGPELGPYLRQHIPRLEGGDYSEGLRSFVAYCLEENAAMRPPIEAVQEHPYIRDTSTQYPASTLSGLVRAFKLWQDDGGSRRSLFMGGGAQGPSEISPADLGDDWNFSTTAAFDQSVAQGANVQDVINVYGASVAINSDLFEETSRPTRPTRQTRRRPPPEALAPLKAPLEKIFDPNTTSNYEENSRNHYNLAKMSDLPLRDDSAQTSIRDTLIDLDFNDAEAGPPSFQDMDTIRVGRHTRNDMSEDEYDSSTLNDFNRAPLSDPVNNPNRRTQDWKFPVMAPPASANPDLSRFPTPREPQRPGMTPGFGGRPALIHHPTEPIGLPSQTFMPSAPSSPTRMSLIDLDLSVPEPSRPSTAGSTTSQEIQPSNPFHLERHASLMQPPPREPSLYLPDGLDIGSGNSIQDLADVSDFSASEEGPHDQYGGNMGFSGEESEESDFPGPLSLGNSGARLQLNSSSIPNFPPLINPPSAAALTGTASQPEMVDEVKSLIENFSSQLTSFKDCYELLETSKTKKKRNENDGE